MISSRRRRTFAIWLSRNFCPPKPGSTVMISTMSNSSRMSKIGSTGSAGRTAKHALQPMSRSWRARRTGAWVAPIWNEMEAAPSFAYSGAQRSGSSIIRCTSTGRSVTSQMRLTMGSPRVRFGTKWWSITSTCTRSALAMALRSRSRLQKSAERMLGAICMLMALILWWKNDERLAPTRRSCLCVMVLRFSMILCDILIRTDAGAQS